MGRVNEWRNKWRDLHIYREYRRGIPRKEISKAYNLEISTVHRVLHRVAKYYGETISVKSDPANLIRYRLYRAGINTKIIAEHYGVARQTIDAVARTVAKDLGDSWEDVKEARARGKFRIFDLSKEIGSQDQAVNLVFNEVYNSFDKSVPRNVENLPADYFIDMLGMDILTDDGSFDVEHEIDLLTQKLQGSREDVLRLAIAMLVEQVETRELQGLSRV